MAHPFTLTAGDFYAGMRRSDDPEGGPDAYAYMAWRALTRSKLVGLEFDAWLDSIGMLELRQYNREARAQLEVEPDGPPET